MMMQDEPVAGPSRLPMGPANGNGGMYAPVGHDPRTDAYSLPSQYQMQHQQHQQQQFHRYPIHPPTNGDYHPAYQPGASTHALPPHHHQQQQYHGYPHGHGVDTHDQYKQQYAGATEEDLLTEGQHPGLPQTAADLMREGPRDFDIIRSVGDGSFGTVFLADWRSPLPSGTKVSDMQRPTTRPQFVGKKLVAIKKMKRAYKNWNECLTLKELKSLLAISPHPHIIPLYDAFLMPETKELHFVFECMEGNLYQLTKSRRGRPFASGLVASIFDQIVRGLHHIHGHGYFHRDMKPENLLLTTLGLAEYPHTRRGYPREKDVKVIVKIADFGLARETASLPPYTEYVSTRWYRAPEILLRARDYSYPVDIWALGTIMAEMTTLRPLFPGSSEVTQVMQICEVLGTPSDEWGDPRETLRGGGAWPRGHKMARAVGFQWPRCEPIPFSQLFSSKIPQNLIDVIHKLLLYEPSHRLTTQGCLDHLYFKQDIISLKGRAPGEVDLEDDLDGPQHEIILNSFHAGKEPPRDLPPSHAHSQHLKKPEFGATSPEMVHASVPSAPLLLQHAAPPPPAAPQPPPPPVVLQQIEQEPHRRPFYPQEQQAASHAQMGPAASSPMVYEQQHPPAALSQASLGIPAHISPHISPQISPHVSQERIPARTPQYGGTVYDVDMPSVTHSTTSVSSPNASQAALLQHHLNSTSSTFFGSSSDHLAQSSDHQQINSSTDSVGSSEKRRRAGWSSRIFSNRKPDATQSLSIIPQLTSQLNNSAPNMPTQGVGGNSEDSMLEVLTDGDVSRSSEDRAAALEDNKVGGPKQVVASGRSRAVLGKRGPDDPGEIDPNTLEDDLLASITANAVQAEDVNSYFGNVLNGPVNGDVMFNPRAADHQAEQQPFRHVDAEEHSRWELQQQRRRQATGASMQSYRTGDSDPGPHRHPRIGGPYPSQMRRGGSATSHASTPSNANVDRRFRITPGPASQHGDIVSEAHSIHSLDSQLMNDFGSMFPRDGVIGSSSGLPRSITSRRQSTGAGRQSRGSGVHVDGASSPMHHPGIAGRFHSYGANSGGRPVSGRPVTGSSGGQGIQLASPRGGTHPYKLPPLPISEHPNRPQRGMSVSSNHSFDPVTGYFAPSGHPIPIHPAYQAEQMPQQHQAHYARSPPHLIDPRLNGHYFPPPVPRQDDPFGRKGPHPGEMQQSHLPSLPSFAQLTAGVRSDMMDH